MRDSILASVVTCDAFVVPTAVYMGKPMDTYYFHFWTQQFYENRFMKVKSIATPKSLLISLLIFVASLGVVVIDRSIFTNQVLLMHAEG